MAQLNLSLVHRMVLLTGLTTLALASGCATSGANGGGANSSDSSGTEDEDAIEVKDEVPSVGSCHTDTQTCDLEEDLQPGLGCFCTNEDGTKEAGSAGG